MNRSRLVSGAAIGIFAALLWIGGEDVSADWVRYVSLATLAAVGIEAAYERWLWALVPGGRSRRLDLRGTWKGELTSHWVDTETGAVPGPVVCYLVVTQTASKIRASLLTEESRSESSVAELGENGAGATLRYLYRNQPQIRVDHRSSSHHGAVALDVNSDGTHLEGHYWTDRKSRGELVFTERTRRQAATFREAEEQGG